MLYDFEEVLRAQPSRPTILRAAYYMSKWDPFLDAARSGTLPTMLPPDLSCRWSRPPISVRAAARLLTEPLARRASISSKGWKRYTPGDVAEAFARALGGPSNRMSSHGTSGEAAYADLGFSPPAAHSYAEMTVLSVEGGFDMPASPERGSTTLQAYIDNWSRRRDRRSAHMLQRAGPDILAMRSFRHLPPDGDGAGVCRETGLLTIAAGQGRFFEGNRHASGCKSRRMGGWRMTVIRIVPNVATDRPMKHSSSMGTFWK